MSTPRHVVERFYDVTNNRGGAGLRDVVAGDIRFVGPLMQASGADQYVAMNEQLLPFHKGWKLLRQFVDGDDVCTIYEMTMGTPSGGTIVLPLVDWIRVSEGRVAEQRIYFDPRQFASAFGMGA